MITSDRQSAILTVMAPLAQCLRIRRPTHSIAATSCGRNIVLYAAPGKMKLVSDFAPVDRWSRCCALRNVRVNTSIEFLSDLQDLLHSRSGSGGGCITDQSYFGVANRVYQSWSLRFSFDSLLVSQSAARYGEPTASGLIAPLMKSDTSLCSFSRDFFSMYIMCPAS